MCWSISHGSVNVFVSNRVLGQRSLSATIQGVLSCGAALKKQKQPKNFPFHLKNLIFVVETELQ